MVFTSDSIEDSRQKRPFLPEIELIERLRDICNGGEFFCFAWDYKFVTLGSYEG